MKEKELNELKTAYKNVFNEQGDVTSCGREKCIILIRTLQKHTKKDVGNEVTGMMNVETIKSVYRELTT